MEKQTLTADDVGLLTVKSKSPRTDALRAQLEEEKNQILAKRQPAREYIDKVMNDPKLIEAKEIIKSTNQALGDVECELAKVARAGGSKGIAVEPGEYSKAKE